MPWDDLEIRVYPGQDGTFVLYEDEGNNYNYEKGKFTEIPMTWNDKTQTLTIGDRKGSYEGMLPNRQFRVKVIGNDTEKTVKYSGKKQTVSF